MLSVNQINTSVKVPQVEFPLGLQVAWQKPEHFAPVTKDLENWLLNTGSLTERLMSLCTEFKVHVIGQAALPLANSEREFSGQQIDKAYSVREVILLCDQQPWVFARSVIPNSLAEGQLAQLGNKPLGKLIFNDPRFVRSDFEVGRLLLNPLNGESVKGSALYARRSLFSIMQHKVLVAEAFLPDCPCYE